MQNWLKEKERVAEANQRVAAFNDSFSKVTEKKLQEKMDAFQENKNAHVRAMQERLNQHVRNSFSMF